jgi:surface protein
VDEYLSSTNPETAAVAATYGYPIGTWNVSRITDFSQVFDAYDGHSQLDSAIASFNEDISQWDVSSATTMYGMFFGASAFNRDLSSWDVSQVTYMYNMFLGATAFNQDLSRWDVGRVTTMYWMFSYATAFNQDLSSWDVSQVTDMSLMFWRATAFNHNLCSWGQKVPAFAEVGSGMFFKSGCPIAASPDKNLSTGPWCHAC